MKKQELNEKSKQLIDMLCLAEDEFWCQYFYIKGSAQNILEARDEYLREKCKTEQANLTKAYKRLKKHVLFLEKRIKNV